MTRTNPDYLGEYSHLYYHIGDYDLTQPDLTILTDAGGDFTHLCVVDVNITRARTLRELVDRCVGDEKEYTGGKRETSISTNINEIRLTSDMIKGWQQISDESGIVCLLILNDDKDIVTATETSGIIGNFLVEQDDDTQPAEGNNVNALTWRPAARSAFDPKVRRIYGSGIT